MWDTIVYVKYMHENWDTVSFVDGQVDESFVCFKSPFINIQYRLDYYTMSRPKTAPGRPDNKNKLEVRADIISYIRNERDTVLKKWMALKENVASEDRQREKFYKVRPITTGSCS